MTKKISFLFPAFCCGSACFMSFFLAIGFVLEFDPTFYLETLQKELGSIIEENRSDGLSEILFSYADQWTRRREISYFDVLTAFCVPAILCLLTFFACIVNSACFITASIDDSSRDAESYPKMRLVLILLFCSLVASVFLSPHKTTKIVSAEDAAALKADLSGIVGESRKAELDTIVEEFLASLRNKHGYMDRLESIVGSCILPLLCLGTIGCLFLLRRLSSQETGAKTSKPSS